MIKRADHEGLCNLFIVFAVLLSDHCIRAPSLYSSIHLYQAWTHDLHWPMTGAGVCCVVAETLRTVAVSSTGLFFMPDSNTSLLGVWNPEGGNVEQHHGQPTAEMYQE